MGSVGVLRGSVHEDSILLRAIATIFRRRGQGPPGSSVSGWVDGDTRVRETMVRVAMSLAGMTLSIFLLHVTALKKCHVSLIFKQMSGLSRRRRNQPRTRVRYEPALYGLQGVRALIAQVHLPFCGAGRLPW